MLIWGRKTPKPDNKDPAIRRIKAIRPFTTREKVEDSRTTIPTHPSEIVTKEDYSSESPTIHTPSPLSEPVISDLSLSVSERTFIDGLKKSDWRGIMPGRVSDINRAHCVVADMGLNCVQILVTKEHSPSGAYISMIADLKKKSYSIEKEEIGTIEAIAHIYALSSKMPRSVVSNIFENDDERFAKLYDDMIASAFRLKASDVHFEIENETRAKVRLRIFGRMREWKTYDPVVLEHDVSAGYNSRTKSGTNSGGNFSLERGMSTMTRHKVDGVHIEGRFSSLPTHNGGDVVVRLLISDPKKIEIPTLEELGYAPVQINQIISALKRNSGLLSIAGSTGAGKTTSLRTFMDIIPRKNELKLVAIEDPVEYQQPGVRKFSIQRGPDDPEEIVKQKYLATLRQQMRMDPDGLMIGEIRDRETGEIASEFVQTGHRVLTTIHGDGCVDVLSRAAGNLIAIPTEIMATRKFYSASIFQKLIPKLCSCKVPAVQVLDTDTLYILKEKYRLDPNTMYCANEDGCNHCRIPGIPESGGSIGQTVCAEILTPTAKMRECIRAHDWNGVEELWRSERRTSYADPDTTGKTAFEHALYKASVGIADIRDIEADFESLEGYETLEIKNKNGTAISGAL